jgi:hypothetical protein
MKNFNGLVLNPVTPMNDSAVNINALDFSTNLGKFDSNYGIFTGFLYKSPIRYVYLLLKGQNQNSMLNSLQINFNKDQSKNVEAEQEEEFEWVEGEFQNPDETGGNTQTNLQGTESVYLKPASNKEELWSFSGEKEKSLDWKEKLEGVQSKTIKFLFFI